MPATLQCPGCQAHLPAVPAWDTCPRCTTPLPARAAAVTTQHHAIGPAARAWLTRTVLGLLLILIVLIAYRAIVPSPAQLRQRQVSRALAACQLALGQAAPGIETPPYAKDYGSRNEFYFAWPTGSFYAARADGSRAPMSASCVGDLPSGTIQHLTLNGQELR